jgi:alpha-2-macroglobulin
MTRVHGRPLYLAALLAMVSLLVEAPPARAQEAEQDARPSFSLASRQIFTSKDSPSIDLEFQLIDHLDFRVYRVKDVRTFFANLKDAHVFGSPEPVVPQERTWLERLADWKSTQRLTIRNFIRRLMSTDYRAERRKRLDQAVVNTRRTVQQASTFAQVPLLNSSQVVASWREILPLLRDGDHRRLPLELPGPGVYLVEAVRPPHRAYTIVIVSDVGLVSKTSPGQALLFAANRFSGDPMAECQTDLLLDRQIAASAKTSSDGVAEATFENHKPDAVIALAQCGNNTVVTDPGSYSLHGEARRMIGYIYTDKPIYRPGHTVRLKGVLRWRANDAIVPFDQPEVEVAIADPDDKVLQRQTLKVDAFGAINTTFPVPASGSLGNYVIRISSGDQIATGAFEVQEYRKPEFEVAVTSPDRYVRQGSKIKATIKARYYFGQPVARGSVTYTLHKSGYYSPLRWRDDSEVEQEYYSDYAGDEISEHKVRLNDQGEATVSIELPLDENSRDYTLRVEARVTDPSGREVSGHGNVIGTYGDFMLIGSPDRYMYSAGGPAAINLRAIDYQGKPQANVTISVMLERRRYPSGYGSEPDVKVITQATVQTDADGRATWQTKLPAESGSYIFHATAPSGDRTLDETTGIWIPGREERTYESDEQYLELVADQKTYAPGQTAKLLVRGADSDATMLVTKEAQTIAWHQVMRVKAGQPVEVPITDADIGDTWINIAFIKNDRLYRAEKRVRVPETSRGLQITVTTDQQVAKPREPGVFTIRTADANGTPVRAQVSLSVVDEAVYAVRPDDTADPVRFFWRREYSRVNTSFSREYGFTGYSGPEALKIALGGASARRRPYSLADFKSGQPERPHVRKEFPDAIFWAGDITTDASGTATVRVNYPDALTTWRLTARGITADTRAGAALNRTTTTKDVILRVITPRFLTEGDTMRLPTVLHNYLPDAKPMTVSVEAKGLTPVDAAATQPKNATIASGEESRMEWPFKADRVGAATVTGTATTPGDGDAVEQTLPVLPYGLKREIGQAGSIAAGAGAGAATNGGGAAGAATGAGGERSVELTIPEKSNPAARTIEVTLAPSLAGALFSGLDFLADYPYGCTEQTVSSFFPNLVVLRTLNELKIAPTERLRVLDRMTADGLKRLYDLQHDDGGWGWWPTDQDHPFMTAYAVGALLEAQRANLKVDVYRLQKGVAATARMYAKYPRAVPELKAYVTYTLSQAIAQNVRPDAGDDGAKFDDKAAIEELWSRRTSMTAYGRALLLLTLNVTKDSRGDTLAKELAGDAQTRGELSWWTSENDPLLDFWEDTSVEATAMAVKALAPHMASDPLMERAARWLLVNRNGGYFWSSTKQTAFALMGLLEHLRARQEKPTTTVVDVEVNGAKVGSHTFTPESWTQPNPVTLSTPGQTGANKVRLIVRSGGAVYWTATARYYDNRESLEQTGTHRLALSRKYFTLSPVTQATRNGQTRIVYRETPFTGTAKPGDLLLVRLVAAGSKDWRYLMIEDPLPAGVEAVRDPDIYDLEHRPTWWYGSKREYRDSRVVQFQNEFSDGRYEYTYLLKVVTPGSFRAMPAQVAPMYVPDVFATTGVQAVEVRSSPGETSPAVSPQAAGAAAAGAGAAAALAGAPAAGAVKGGVQ